MAKKIDRKKISLIHVAKSQVGMTEAEYRDLLASVKVASSKALTLPKFKHVMKRFQELGFKSKFTGGRTRPRPAMGKKQMVDKIGAILADLKLPWTYVDSIAKKRFGVEVLEWCDDEQTYKILQMMAVYQRRQEKKSAAGKIKNMGGER